MCPFWASFDQYICYLLSSRMSVILESCAKPKPDPPPPLLKLSVVLGCTIQFSGSPAAPNNPPLQLPPAPPCSLAEARCSWGIIVDPRTTDNFNNGVGVGWGAARWVCTWGIPAEYNCRSKNHCNFQFEMGDSSSKTWFFQYDPLTFMRALVSLIFNYILKFGEGGGACEGTCQ